MYLAGSSARVGAQRCSQCAFWRPSELHNAAKQRSLRNAPLRRPLRQRHASSIEFDDVVGSHVPHLLLARRPAAVVGSVVPVVVTSIDRVTGWARSHVSKEVLEATPSLNDRNAAPAIVDKGLIRRIAAPALDAAPRIVFTTERSAVRGSAQRIARGTQTATAFHRAASERLRVSRLTDVTTVALVGPRARDAACDEQSAKPLAD